MDADRPRHRRRRQQQRSGRDAGDGGRGDPRLRRPRRGDHLDARLRPARRRDRRRPLRPAAGPRGGRETGRRPGGHGCEGIGMSTIAVVGNPKPHSRTRSAAELVVQRLTGAPPDRVVDVVEVGAGLLDGGAPAAEDAVAARKAADLAVVASPTYKATYTGLL